MSNLNLKYNVQLFGVTSIRHSFLNIFLEAILKRSNSRPPLGNLDVHTWHNFLLRKPKSLGRIVKEFKSCKRGAGIDTYEFEGPYIPKNFEGQEMTDSLFKALINHPKVIYMPHAAYYIDDAVKKTS
ncbi:D-lactate dehydrogenase [Streptococcus dysgalactiae]|nr:D-lactate dehydrogenase [Streptococcus dysgalactiae subsp. dysgalactiae]SUN50416.1 D-lactate dehydrogenase [Streptococcus dysgalactiae]SUN55379.1 D-lactate dehydrogenase [Streptococcus dysgalactiae]